MQCDALVEADLLARTEEPCVFIDTRPPDAYAAGHIVGAVNMPEIFSYVGPSSPAGLAALRETFVALFGAAGLSGSERAVLYEDAMDTGNGRSCRGYFLLSYLGYPRASVLHGGLEAWRAAGLAIDRQPVRPKPAAFPLALNPAVLVTQADVQAIIGDPSTTLLDVRDPAEWHGHTAGPTEVDPLLRPGRIPGAAWLPWKHLLENTPRGSRILPAARVRDLCSGLGIMPSSRVILYCFKGSRAACALIALQRAGFQAVQNYFASWNEWGRNPSLPVALAS